MLTEAETKLDKLDPTQNAELLKPKIKEPWSYDLDPYMPYGLRRR